MQLVPPTATPWTSPREYWPMLADATHGLETPVGVLCAEALAHNAFDMLRRAAGTPIRVASKSVRVRGVLDAVLALPGYAGVLAYTLPEALWLAETIDDVVVGYPTVDRAAIAALARDDRLAARVTLMIDSVAHLDLVDAIVPPRARPAIRVAIELDASWDGPVGHIGVHRSPLHAPAQVRALAEEVARRPGFALVGLMAYEAQIAGLANRPASRVRGTIIRALQSRSMRELRARRGETVAAVRQVAELEFVNGGGTGSLESTAADPSVTEIAAGSGLFGPHLFDQYAHFQPAPAAAFALSVVRKPEPAMATLLGGGWIASGPPTADRQPQLAWPLGLELLPQEMAGEVQTPLRGRGAASLRLGDRVFLRHTKAGELSEHLLSFAVVEGGRVTETLPTYRGEGKVFL
ncbi:alanine racemase [Galbitalea soli]|uniref:Amino acid deaminase/aldolase n=1 Tax=Galbitalea soli TaxID=1268042 RepID=A0A7C9TQ21_9MICO|nr:alanine racemase [Galbitalea soli]NEM90679.1 amino acid deaminase/aldolase [Galbitalea soli]NYJ31397.1 D-serine deaminase-like pyridoxal phosphate-dependent protein [Galbitalea soli]